MNSPLFKPPATPCRDPSPTAVNSLTLLHLYFGRFPFYSFTNRGCKLHNTIHVVQTFYTSDLNLCTYMRLCGLYVHPFWTVLDILLC